LSTCGKKNSDDDEILPVEEPIHEERPPAPPSTPPVTPLPATVPTEIWIATNNNKAIARYSNLNGV